MDWSRRDVLTLAGTAAFVGTRRDAKAGRDPLLGDALRDVLDPRLRGS